MLALAGTDGETAVQTPIEVVIREPYDLFVNRSQHSQHVREIQVEHIEDLKRRTRCGLIALSFLQSFVVW